MKYKEAFVGASSRRNVWQKIWRRRNVKKPGVVDRMGDI